MYLQKGQSINKERQLKFFFLQQTIKHDEHKNIIIIFHIPTGENIIKIRPSGYQ